MALAEAFSKFADKMTIQVGDQPPAATPPPDGDKKN
jgi:hypothetical protein